MKEYTNKYCNINILKFREGSVFKLYDGHTPKYSLNTNLFPVSYKYIYISKFVFILSILKIFIARCPTEDLTSVVTVWMFYHYHKQIARKLPWIYLER